MAHALAAPWERPNEEPKGAARNKERANWRGKAVVYVQYLDTVLSPPFYSNSHSSSHMHSSSISNLLKAWLA